MEQTSKVDVAVIGAGTAGLAAYRAAIAAGKRAVVIESGAYGTTCARVGCMPSKLLIAAADAAHAANHAAPFGVHANVRVDGIAVMDRVRRERDRFVGFVLEGVDAIPTSDRIVGRAQLLAPGLVAVGEQRIEANAVVVATGSAPVVPPMFERVRDRLVINDDVFAWETLPRSIAVFGGGVIGLELGQALARLGVRVHVYGRGGAVGPLTDPAVRDAALTALREDVAFDPDADVVDVRPGGDGVEVVTREGAAAEERVRTFGWVLVATGRRPRVNGLGLDHAGALLDRNGLPIVDTGTMQCGDGPLFVAGDANNDLPLLHEAADEGRIAGENAARYPDVRPALRRTPLGIVFTDPNIAVVGASHASLLASRGAANVVVGAVSFADQGRSRVMRQNKGRGHLYFDRESGRFLGAELAAPRAEHLGHLLAWAHQLRLSPREMLAMPFYHPVVEEGLRTALRDAVSKLT